MNSIKMLGFKYQSMGIVEFRKSQKSFRCCFKFFEYEQIFRLWMTINFFLSSIYGERQKDETFDDVMRDGTGSPIVHALKQPPNEGKRSAQGHTTIIVTIGLGLRIDQ